MNEWKPIIIDGERAIVFSWPGKFYIYTERGGYKPTWPTPGP